MYTFLHNNNKLEHILASTRCSGISGISLDIFALKNYFKNHESIIETVANNFYQPIISFQCYLVATHTAPPVCPWSLTPREFTFSKRILKDSKACQTLFTLHLVETSQSPSCLWVLKRSGLDFLFEVALL